MSGRINWTDEEIATVFLTVQVAACPHCKTTSQPIIVRSEKCGSETRRKCVCRACSRPYKIIVEHIASGWQDSALDL